MPKCRRGGAAASRGQVLLLRLLLVCMLVTAGRQEGKFYEGGSPHRGDSDVERDFKTPAFASRPACQSAGIIMTLANFSFSVNVKDIYPRRVTGPQGTTATDRRFRTFACMI